MTSQEIIDRANPIYQFEMEFIYTTHCIQHCECACLYSMNLLDTFGFIFGCACVCVCIPVFSYILSEQKKIHYGWSEKRMNPNRLVCVCCHEMSGENWILFYIFYICNYIPHSLSLSYLSQYFGLVTTLSISASQLLSNTFFIFILFDS